MASIKGALEVYINTSVIRLPNRSPPVISGAIVFIKAIMQLVTPLTVIFLYTY